jgi:iron(III) transport system permease protein
VFYFINLPLAKPALFSVWLLVFIKGFTEFDVPAVIGLPAGYRVITSHIYTLLRNYPVDYQLASAFSMLLVIIILLAVWLNKSIFRESLRYATIKGEGYRRPAMERGIWTYIALIAVILYLFISVVMPFLILLWSSLQPYYEVPGIESLKNLTFANYVTLFRYPNISGAILRSFWLSITAGVIVMMLSIMTGMYTVRSRLPGRSLLDGLVTLPMIFPGVVLGAAIILVYLRLPLPVYGTVLLLLIGYVTHGLPYGVRYISSALIQIHPELEEAALVCGATKLQQVLKITLPLLRASLISGWLYIIVLTMRNLSIALLLYKPGSEVLSVAIWDLWATGGYVTLSALGSLLIIVLLLLAVLAGNLNKPGFSAIDYRSGGADVIDERTK